ERPFVGGTIALHRRYPAAASRGGSPQPSVAGPGALLVVGAARHPARRSRDGDRAQPRSPVPLHVPVSERAARPAHAAVLRDSSPLRACPPPGKPQPPYVDRGGLVLAVQFPEGGIASQAGRILLLPVDVLPAVLRA